MNVQIDPSWKTHLQSEFEKEYFKSLVGFIKQEYQSYKAYPRGKDIFRAFELCPFDRTKVIIIGQDPYHGAGQAHGLSFSVHANITIPPSLVNIFTELNQDIGKPIPQHGDLSAWAKQGVLLLNATLTVRAKQAGSHQGRGWEQFTDAVIELLSTKRENLVFILWGSYAKNKGVVIDKSKHLVLSSTHPSPMSANRGGFFGNKHFSKANSYLIKHKKGPIIW